jgi:SagB-type dehydrogenase family enzyme
MKVRALVLALFVVASGCAVYAQAPQTIPLPAPQKEGGKPLMQALSERKSTREFSNEQLPLPVLSNLLWAACGINRPTGQRTAPSANNKQEIDVYVALPGGLYLYEPKAHELRLTVAEDLRGATGSQPFVKDAALNLIYVADQAKAGRRAEDLDFYNGTDSGLIAQNVYLFCASEGLATVVRGGVDRDALAKAMKLRPDQKVTLAQTVGYGVGPR